MRHGWCWWASQSVWCWSRSGCGHAASLDRPRGPPMSEIALARDTLPAGSVSYRSAGWWAMMYAIASEAALFGYLLFSYYYFAIQPHVAKWPPEPMGFKLSVPNTIILVLSSVAVWWAERGLRKDVRWQQASGLLVG